MIGLGSDKNATCPPPSPTLLRPGETTQQAILADAVAELLWKVKVLIALSSEPSSDFVCTLQAGAGERAVLAIPDSVASFEPGQESAGFTTDGLTEKASRAVFLLLGFCANRSFNETIFIKILPTFKY